jgi:uncharacterized glyoxalase superfamily protein PhnB
MATKKKAAKASKKAAPKAVAKKKSAAPVKNAAASAKVAAKKKPAKAAKKSSSSVGLNITAVAPGLTVNDIQASLAWYRDVLGFRVGERWEMNGQLMGVEMSAGETIFMIGQDDWKKGRDRVKGQGVRIYCETNQDIDKLAAQIRKNGGTLTQEPKDQTWGMRDMALADPDGYLITIGATLKKKKKR